MGPSVLHATPGPQLEPLPVCAVLRRKGSQSPSIDIEAQEPLRAHELR